jgi:uncharacterized cupredoxin-like copper-binding protein
MRIRSVTLSAALAAALLAGGAALADTGHGRRATPSASPARRPRRPAPVEVAADDRDGMRYSMDLGSIRQGETIRFVVTNQGEGPHEFTIGDTASQRAHARLMAKNPEMHHDDDPSAVTLRPGETKELVWSSASRCRASSSSPARCPGHYDAGMVHKAKLEKAGKAKTS